MATSTPSPSETSGVIVMPVRRRFFERPPVTLIVGENERPFYVHPDLLYGASPFFMAAFTGGFKESSEKTMHLPEDEGRTFELFVHWLYYGSYEMLPEVEYDDADNDADADADDHNEDIVDDDKRYLEAFRLYVLADKYEICELKDLVIERLFTQGRYCRNAPHDASIAYAYKHTTQGSGLRKLLADWNAWNVDLGEYKLPETQVFMRQHPDFATDVIVSFAKYFEKGPTYNPFQEDMPEEYKD